MKTKITATLFLMFLACIGYAQNQLITPAGKPLVIGNQGGVKLSNLNANSPTQPANGKALSVDASGTIVLVPSGGGSASSNARESAASENSLWSETENGNLVNSNAGGVIIGSGMSATPAGYKLYVSDGILTERVKVALKSTADWRDNVLEDDYRLRTVEEVETFIKQHRHLPGVPTALDMVKNGNDLNQTDAVLLEKIEEMMLYIIELKKENTKLLETQKAVLGLMERVQALEKK